MINASSAFRRKLNNDERDYLEQISMTLKDGTELSLTNADIWGGSLSFDDSVGSDNSFSALGSCIVNSLKFTLNNIYDDFSEYDFLDAVSTVKIGLDIDGTPEMLKKGVFTVVDPTYNGSTISLVLHDNMAKFDRPYSDSTLVYPASLDTIVRNLCTVCGVNLATSSLNFPRKDFVINERPSDEATTCREVLSWCATIAGCFARCNADGELELKWFDTDSFGTAAETLDGGRFDNHDPNVYVTGDTADGGTFNPWSTGDAYDGGSFDYTSIHIINSLYSQNIAVDDVVITQIQAEVKVKADTGDAVVTYSEGQPGYAIKISGNEFINETNAQNIVSYLGLLLIGLTFRKANVSHSSDPTIEAGDCAFVYDRKGNRYQILVTRTNFTIGSAQTTVCGADTPARNSAARFSEQTKSYVELRKQIVQVYNPYAKAMSDLASAVSSASGMHKTEVQQLGGGVITYWHNLPNLNESDIQIMISDVGYTFTNNGTDSEPIWYGFTMDGQILASVLNVVGINAEWINTGQLVVRKQVQGVENYFNTISGMDLIVNTRQDDVNNLLTGVNWFTFDSRTASTIQVSSNSKINIGRTDTSSTGDGDLNFFRRDGQLVKLYRQEGSFDNTEFLKIRYEGYTRHNLEYQTDEYKLVYELFLLSDNTTVLNLIQIPTNTSYLGTNSIITSAGTSMLSLPSIGAYLLTEGSDNKWYITPHTFTNPEVLFVDVDTGIVRISGNSINISSGDVISTAINQQAQAVADEKISQLEIGGRNMLYDTNAPTLGAVDGNGARWFTSESALTNGSAEWVALPDSPVDVVKYGAQFICTTTGGASHLVAFYDAISSYQGGAFIYEDFPSFKSGQTYTASVWVKTDTPGAVIQARLSISYSYANPNLTTLDKTIETANKWTRCTWTFTFTGPDTTSIGFQMGFAYNIPATVYMCGFQLETGSVVTDWSEYPKIYTSYGGRNLIRNTNNVVISPIAARPNINGYYNFGQVNWVGSASVEEHGIKTRVSGSYPSIQFGSNSTTEGDLAKMSLYGLEPGQEYTLSFDYECKLFSNRTSRYAAYLNATIWTYDSSWQNLARKYLVSYRQNTYGSIASGRGTFTFKIPKTGVDKIFLTIRPSSTSSSDFSNNDYISLRNMKLEKGNRATDWSAAPEDIEGEIAEIESYAQSLGTQIDGKAETWYQASDPSTNWTAAGKTAHIGDLWYNTTATVQKYYRYDGTNWQEITSNPPTAVFDRIDGKAQVFTSTPTVPYAVGDLWFNSDTSDIMTCVTARSTGSYTASDWAKRNKYTDDTAVTTLDNSLNQQNVFNRLTNNGQAQGIYLDNGKLYLNFEYAVGQTLKLGKANNTGGTLEIYDSSNTRVGLWNNGALYIGNISGTSQTPSSPNTKINTNGAITTKSLTANDYVYVNGNTSSYIKSPFGNTSQNYFKLSSEGFFIVNGNLTVKVEDVPSHGNGIILYKNNNTYNSFIGEDEIQAFYQFSYGTVYCDVSLDNGFGGVVLDVRKNSKTYGLEIPLTSSNPPWIRGGLYVTDGKLTAFDDFTCQGTKSRAVETSDYSSRLLYCYETPSPMFGDVGEGTIGNDGKCYVMIDSIFAETVTLSQYQIFLQKYGDGDCWVAERKSAYFIVEGTPGLSFGWELKAKQSDFDQLRLEENRDFVSTDDVSKEYGIMLTEHIENLRKEREVV